MKEENTMITPYLTFNGNCKDALDFYQTVFPCGEPAALLYGDYMPEGSKTPPELLRTWVMHAEMVVCGTNVWFADEAVPFKKGDSIRLSAIVSTGEEATAIYESLREGGSVTLPPTETFYSVFHAAVTDKFDVNWNIVAEEAPAQED
jgi:PhnB protein